MLQKSYLIFGQQDSIMQHEPTKNVFVIMIHRDETVFGEECVLCKKDLA